MQRVTPAGVLVRARRIESCLVHFLAVRRAGRPKMK